MILPYTANREAIDRKAWLAGNGRVLVKRHNTASDGFTARPSGAIQMIQYRVAALEKGLPEPAPRAKRVLWVFPAGCALS